jgi:hypothetical protein
MASKSSKNITKKSAKVDPNKKSGRSAKLKSKKKKIKLAKEQEAKIERSMSVAGTLRKAGVKRKKSRSISEETEVLKRKRNSKVADDEDEDIEDEDEDTVAGISDAVDADDEDGDEDEHDESEDDDDALTLADQIAQCDPGPAVTEVDCGFNCGSCDKFVAINPLRENSEWLTTQVNKKAKSRCPFLFPDELDIADDKSINDYVMRADSKACDQFRFNENRGSEHIRTCLDLIREHIPNEELAILQFQIEQTRKIKKESASNGYSLGSKVQLRMDVRGVERLVTFKVIDFQRKKGAEVIVRPITAEPGVPSRVAIPALRFSNVD